MIKIKTPAKRKEILFTRTQMEVMGESGLVELAKHGTPYERMHAQGILDDRKAGQISTHGRAPVMAIGREASPGSTFIGKLKPHGNVLAARYHQKQETGKHAYSASGINDPSLRRRNRQS